MEWSKYFQNPIYMEMTRKAILNGDMRPLIMKYCGIKQGMQLLDVGCGTGSFTCYLAEGEKDLKVTGIDNDAVFIEQARIITQDRGLSDRLEFITGDACNLPFPEKSFDGVVSHTFLTSVTDPQKALSEMMRVARPGSFVSSITAMSFGNQTWHRGYYPDECIWYEKLIELEAKVWRMFQSVDPLSNYTGGIPASEMPHFFSIHGLKEVCMYPIGKAFSLSNAAMTADEKLEYIMGMYNAEKQKLLNFMELEETWKYISRDDCDVYFRLLLAKRDFLLENIGENSIWEWYGGANVLITGKL